LLDGDRCSPTGLAWCAKLAWLEVTRRYVMDPYDSIFSVMSDAS
jgi:hypothetical protein